MGPQHPMTAAMETNFRVSIVFQCAPWMTPWRWWYDHWWPHRCHTTPKPAVAATVSSNPPNNPNSRASPIFNMGEHDPQSCFSPGCLYRHWWQRQPPHPHPHPIPDLPLPVQPSLGNHPCFKYWWHAWKAFTHVILRNVSIHTFYKT